MYQVTRQIYRSIWGVMCIPAAALTQANLQEVSEGVLLMQSEESDLGKGTHAVL